ncbi:tetratricopeptide repeat protein [Paenibacillus sp. GSMTC-2017]|uniref:tetratricopeptide repeat protein n=1 Tax=Paenibacillus sp. GSMTC-2017 TaxID=2794350 RepID=UPI0018D5C223|nr:tetratricopeptide repeat protein [Paenibacillus sp. GSMTC-2017]MBH5318312.1 tetratricopeptide repeat protein [Paenibacillus sp. GSMTC-2017]
MSINQKAIQFLENNEYDEALKLFQKAVEQSRTIQSLNNLAWIYYHEESDKEAALKLIKEAIELNPISHFPYNLLGEIYIEMEMWQLAFDVLHQSILIHPSNEAYHNLAVANYHLGHLEEASHYYLLCSNKSDHSLYSHVKCLIELGRNEEAKNKLSTFSEEEDEFVGTVEIAELYVELGCFEQSVQWFEKGWKQYWKTPDWVSRYVYALLKINDPNCARHIINEVIQQKVEQISEARAEICDDDWTEREKAEYIQQLLDEKSEYENMYEHISFGYIPLMKFSTSMSSSCYLFGCKRHNHPEYPN